MKKRWLSAFLVCLLGGANTAHLLRAQEASSGFDVRATLTAQAVAANELTDEPRSGSPFIVGSRSVLYPTLKFSDNWFVTGALQLATRLYFYDEFSTVGYGAKGVVLQSTINYSRVSNSGSILVRAGEMSTAFGSFPLRYDDAENALVDFPIPYGYYYSPVSILGVAGAQMDASRGKLDGRVQFANSSPANPRSLFGHDQYGNWAGGAGYTIRQGFRVGVSAYRGPYLDHNFRFFYPGEGSPSTLPAHALGMDVSWVHGHTSAQGELQKFVMPYTQIPTFRESAGYGEIKRVLNPRWYLAARGGFSTANASGKEHTFEIATGFRPNRFQLLKVEYEYDRYSTGSDRNDNVFAIQFITSLHRGFSRR
jgi:hypothetical protein